MLAEWALIFVIVMPGPQAGIIWAPKGFQSEDDCRNEIASLPKDLHKYFRLPPIALVEADCKPFMTETI